MSNFITDSIRAETSLQNGGIEASLRMGNMVYVKTNPGPGEFSSIVSALASITTASTTNRYTILVGPGTYTESQLTMKSFVYIYGFGDSTIVQPSNASQNFVIAIENASINNLILTGVTGSGFASIFMASTTSSATASFWCEDIKFGNNDIHMIVSATAADNSAYCRNCRIGNGYQFNNGFKATTTSTGIGKIILQNCSTNVMTGTLPTYVAYASGTSCQIVINSCQFNTGGTSSGSCVQVDNGAELRILSLNAKGYAKAIWSINSGSAPTVYCDAVTLETNTEDIQIDHTGTTGNFIGIADLKKVTNSSTVFGTMIVDSLTGVTSIRGFRAKQDATVTSNSTVTLVGGSGFIQTFTGTTAGQAVQLPDATTLQTGHQFEIWNQSTVNITIKNGSGTIIALLGTLRTSKIVLQDNSTTAGVWMLTQDTTGNYPDVSAGWQVFEDFPEGTDTGVTTSGIMRWSILTTGAGALTGPSPNADSTHFGVVNMAATAVSDIAALRLTQIALGGAEYTLEYLIRVGALGTGTQNYTLQIGLGDNVNSGSDPANGVFWEYSQAADTHWRARCAKTSTYTNTASTTAVAANSWYKLKIVINAAGTSAAFSVSPAGGGPAVFSSTIATNIPTAKITPFFQIRKTVGGSAVSFDADYYMMNVAFTSAR